MSRTYRRTKYKPDTWVTQDWDRFVDSEGLYFWRDFQLQGKEREEAIRKYYSDGGTGDYWLYNAPKWFRKDIERIKRAKEKHELRRMMVQGDYENYSFTPRRKDAGWLWW